LRTVGDCELRAPHDGNDCEFVDSAAYGDDRDASRLPFCGNSARRVGIHSRVQAANEYDHANHYGKLHDSTW